MRHRPSGRGAPPPPALPYTVASANSPSEAKCHDGQTRRLGPSPFACDPGRLPPAVTVAPARAAPTVEPCPHPRTVNLALALWLVPFPHRERAYASPFGSARPAKRHWPYLGVIAARATALRPATAGGSTPAIGLAPALRAAILRELPLPGAELELSAPGRREGGVAIPGSCTRASTSSSRTCVARRRGSSPSITGAARRSSTSRRASTRSSGRGCRARPSGPTRSASNSSRWRAD
jgi:hypothetical protein